MKTPQSAASIEPSVEAVVTIRQRLHQMGFIVSDEAARELLRAVLAVESARLDRRAREAAAACLRSIQDAAQEAMRILTQGSPASKPQQQAPAPASAPAPVAERQAVRPRPDGVDLAEVVRRRLADEAPVDAPARRPVEPAPAPVPARPVFKGRRGR
jgi:hypothetical protein